MNALSSLHVATVVGLIRRASVASDVDCRMRREHLSRHVAAVVGLIRRASVASDVDCRMRGQRRILLQIVRYIKTYLITPLRRSCSVSFFQRSLAWLISSIFIKITTFLLFISETFIVKGYCPFSSVIQSSCNLRLSFCDCRKVCRRCSLISKSRFC